MSKRNKKKGKKLPIDKKIELLLKILGTIATLITSITALIVALKNWMLKGRNPLLFEYILTYSNIYVNENNKHLLSYGT